MKRKSLVLAAMVVFMLGMATHAAGQIIPAIPGKSGTSGQPVAPGAPGQPALPDQPGVPGRPAMPGQQESVMVPGSARLQITPFVNAKQEYTSNVFLTQNNKKEDWITTVAPGVTLSANEARYGISLTGIAGYNWYARETKEDYWSVDGTLNLRYNPDPRLTFRLREYILRSEDSVSPAYQTGQGGFLTGAYQGNTPYVRNVVEPSVDWQFARDSSIGVLYRNNILKYEKSNVSYEDSTENYIQPRFTYAINQKNTIALDYGFTKGEYSREAGGPVTPDFVSQSPHGRYIYRVSPLTSVFLDYIYFNQDNDDPGIDYQVNNPSVGVEHYFNPSLVGVAQVGYYWMNPSRLEGEGGVTSTVSLTQRDMQTTYYIAFNSGWQVDQFTFQNLGFSRYYGGSASITHLITQRLSVALSGALQYVDYAFIDRNDWLYWADGVVSYQLLRWLALSGGAGLRKDDSSLEGSSYSEWHAFLSLTMSYDALGR